MIQMTYHNFSSYKGFSVLLKDNEGNSLRLKIIREGEKVKPWTKSFSLITNKIFLIIIKNQIQKEKL